MSVNSILKIVVALIYCFYDAIQSRFSCSTHRCHDRDCRSWRLAITVLSYRQLNLNLEQNLNCFTQQAILIQALLQLFNDLVKPAQHARFLGVEFDKRLRYENHIDDIVGRANTMNVLRVLSRAGTDGKTLIKLYKLYIRPLFEYGSAAFIAAPSEQRQKIQKTQRGQSPVEHRGTGGQEV